MTYVRIGGKLYRVNENPKRQSLNRLYNRLYSARGALDHASARFLKAAKDAWSAGERLEDIDSAEDYTGKVSDNVKRIQRKILADLKELDKYRY